MLSLNRSALFIKRICLPNNIRCINERTYYLYYKRKQTWIAKKIRSLTYRYRTLPAIVFAILTGALFVHGTISYNLKCKKILREQGIDAMIDFKEKYKAVMVERAKFGERIHIPFFGTDIALEQNERTDEIYKNS